MKVLKLSFVLFSSILLFNSCNQSENQNSETIGTEISNLISTNPCDKFIGKYSRQQTVKLMGTTTTTISNVEIKQNGKMYKVFISTLSNSPALDAAANKMVNETTNSRFPSDGFSCGCNEKGNIGIDAGSQKEEYTLDANGDLIASGYTFKRVDKFESEAAPEENINEVSTEVSTETSEIENHQLEYEREDVEPTVK